jgi:hypothetical protein
MREPSACVWVFLQSSCAPRLPSTLGEREDWNGPEDPFWGHGLSCWRQTAVARREAFAAAMTFDSGGYLFADL